MSEQDNVRVAEQIFAAFNSHDLKLSRPYEATGYLTEAPGSARPMDADQARAYNQVFLDAFPDLHFDLKQKIAQGDFVVVNWVASGTHKGGLRTPTGHMVAPTGKKAMVTGSTTLQFKNGKAAYAWVFWDMASLLSQLGLMPEM